MAEEQDEPKAPPTNPGIVIIWSLHRIIDALSSLCSDRPDILVKLLTTREVLRGTYPKTK